MTKVLDNLPALLLSVYLLPLLISNFLHVAGNPHTSGDNVLVSLILASLYAGQTYLKLAPKDNMLADRISKIEEDVKLTKDGISSIRLGGMRK